MRLKVLGCYGGQLLGFRLTSFLVNNSILLDAGSPTEALSLEAQHDIRHICLSHTHLDHIKDIAFLADNRSLKRMGGSIQNRTICIHSLAENNRVLRDHFFNEAIWPDFTRIPTMDDPILKLVDMEAEKPFVIDGITITAIRVNHPVPCTGFLVDDGTSQLIYSADTGNTDRLWEIANAQPNLKAVILDCSFPNAYQRLADISGHMTPQGMMQDLQKFTLLGKVPVYLYHMKPETLNIMTAEVEVLDVPHLRMLTQVDELLI
ncbi:MAG: MBL fold metallo-hydrolase [Zetaproteobacteria bacterium CG12_big_fil_rev_8_21_14_0_65_54_13]|nr:MAG: MBL fold metallo-hydrolase [Zetaproteobacteria bacterium CG23_combo_of_CG06-09_8_20_14_all_54_7]PIW48257.1 MAG: MBL fold metallo-hydrolase [Zetaproteobacteria bacterium CG12_big_fil_rev_8_21_14_0_65_54_13]PIX54557.1 MAG: MBL fold metallo-hydrolase [Zetaproteobacteria bacterium CG_4_10_14_3_um_filter_54_28]PJA29725.1 MAG: MBL fold metallo-hydrolase [Zetaproteobacteria bacterium CG_4_9_14_3_um_filter_54_145]